MYNPLHHRNIAHAPNEDYPDSLRIVARWGDVEKTIDIDADVYFGRGGSSPLSGESLMAMLNNLRRQGPKREGDCEMITEAGPGLQERPESRDPGDVAVIDIVFRYTDGTSTNIKIPGEQAFGYDPKLIAMLLQLLRGQ